LRILLSGESLWDPLTIAVAVAIMAGTAMLASAVPARRAARVDPAIALRSE
jgi:ABC-type antimicrobial peptide transport system permease subunit